MTHTPGPWRIVRTSEWTADPEDTAISHIEGADGRSVYYTDSGYFKPANQEADCRLIAAAPDMLALLAQIKASLELMDSKGFFEPNTLTWRVLRAHAYNIGEMLKKVEETP